MQLYGNMLASECSSISYHGRPPDGTHPAPDLRTWASKDAIVFACARTPWEPDVNCSTCRILVMVDCESNKRSGLGTPGCTCSRALRKRIFRPGLPCMHSQWHALGDKCSCFPQLEGPQNRTRRHYALVTWASKVPKTVSCSPQFKVYGPLCWVLWWSRHL